MKKSQTLIDMLARMRSWEMLSIQITSFHCFVFQWCIIQLLYHVHVVHQSSNSISFFLWFFLLPNFVPLIAGLSFVASKHLHSLLLSKAMGAILFSHFVIFQYYYCSYMKISNNPSSSSISTNLLYETVFHFSLIIFFSTPAICVGILLAIFYYW